MRTATEPAPEVRPAIDHRSALPLRPLREALISAPSGLTQRFR